MGEKTEPLEISLQDQKVLFPVNQQIESLHSSESVKLLNSEYTNFIQVSLIQELQFPPLPWFIMESPTQKVHIKVLSKEFMKSTTNTALWVKEDAKTALSTKWGSVYKGLIKDVIYVNIRRAWGRKCTSNMCGYYVLGSTKIFPKRCEKFLKKQNFSEVYYSAQVVYKKRGGFPYLDSLPSGDVITGL